MGTKVHFRSCFPGHDKMRDLNADADNSWPSFFISKTFNGNIYNGCFPSPSTGYSEYDKEMLKRTILEHEAIFRKQVYELHRLYGIQKDLMEELQKNGLSAISEHKFPSKTISRSSQVRSDYATRMREISHLCAMNDCKIREKPRYNDDIIFPVNFPESIPQSSSGFIETETLQRVAESDGSFIKCPKRMLDFRLPACAYFDYTEKSEEIPGSSSVNTSTCSRICTGDSDIEFNHNIVSVSDSSVKEDCKLNYLYKKSFFTGLADSDEPNRQTSVEEGAPNSFPVMVFGPKSQMEENHRLNFPLSSTTLNLQIAFTNDGDCGEPTLSNVFQGVKEELSRGAVCYNEPGKLFPVSSMNSAGDKEKDPMLCEPVKLNFSKVSDIISIDHNEASTRFGNGHEQINHFLKSGKCSGHSESGNLGKLTSVLSNSFSSSFKLESNMTSLSLVPTWMKLCDENHASSLFSAISSFDGSSGVKKFCSSDIATKDPNGASESWQVCFDLKSPLRFEEKYSSHLNGLNDRLQLQSHSTSHERFPFTNLNLNVQAENSFSGTQDGPTAWQNKATNDLAGKCEDFLPGLSWLKRMPACESLEPSRVPFPVDIGFSKMNQEDAISLLSCNFEVFSSSQHNRESKIQNNQPSDSMFSMKFIASNFDKLQENLSSSSNEGNLVIDELKHVSMSHDIKMYSSKQSTSSEKNWSNTRNCIDLNSMFSLEDDPDSSESSAKVQADAPSINSEPISVSRVEPSIDLEAPVITMEEENITSDMASTPSNSKDGLQEELCSCEIIIKEAAENIVKLSLDGFKLKDEIQISLSATPPAKALYRFAEIILSSNNIIELNAASDCHLQHQDDGLDLFELMTLQLEEMKPKNLCCRFQEAENAEANERSKASLLVARPRRAQGKKRRQKKDFQKDILPALATLSRQESMEDLQAIGVLMKARGMPWQAGIRRRNIRANGAQPQAIRKLRRRNTIVSVTKVQIDPPKVQIDPPTALFVLDGNNYNPEFEVSRHHMISWGRTTRRCRSQRCPSVSISSTLI